MSPAPRRARWLELGAAVLGLSLVTCQLAKPTPKEHRLLERSKGAAPGFAAPKSYPLDPSELIQNGQFVDGIEGWTPGNKPTITLIGSQRPGGGQALRIESSSVTQPFAASALSAGRAYRLVVSARTAGAEEAWVAIKFREPKHKGTYRTFRERITGDKLREYTLELTTPAYTGLAELAIEARGGAVVVESVSLRMREPIPRTEAVTSWSGSFVPDGYALVFNDEFSGAALNRRKWFTRYIYSSETLDRLNDENQRYADNDNHRVAGGILQLVAKRLKLSKVSGINYESGMIRSDFTAHYGFFETRVKMPGGLGVWPAFWLNSDVSETGMLSHPPEIDFFEFVNNGKDDKVNKIHSAATRDFDGSNRFLYMHERFKEQHKDWHAPFNFNEGWHTIGGEWTPTELSVYVDGLKIFTRTLQWKYKDGTLAGPAHVLLNLAIGGQWAGRYGIDDSAFPQALAVDWVRVYQKQD